MKKIRKLFYLFLCFAATTIFLSTAVLAWKTSQSANTICSDGNTAKIRVSFTNNEEGRAINVKVKDQQTGNSTNLGAIEGGQTKTGEIDTDKESIMDGVVTFFLTWADGKSGSDKRSAQYQSISCVKPSPTPTSTPMPTPTLTPSETPTPTANPTPTPTPTSTSPNVGGGSGDGRSDGLGCASHDCSGNPAPQKEVLGASTGPAVLGLSATSSDNNVIIVFAQIFAALAFSVTGFKFFKKNV